MLFNNHAIFMNWKNVNFTQIIEILKFGCTAQESNDLIIAKNHDNNI